MHSVTKELAARTRVKGLNQLAHMGIRYHFIANLHITETRSILFSTKYDKIILLDKQKRTQKRVSWLMIENQGKTAKIEANFYMYSKSFFDISG